MRRRVVLSWEHIYSHQGHVWNDLADAGARAYSVGRLRTIYSLPPLLSTPSRKALLPLAFLQLLSYEERLQYPPMVSSNRMLASSFSHNPLYGLPADILAKSIDHPSVPLVGDIARGPTNGETHHAAVTAVSFNPQTLRPLHKRNSFAHQFRGLHVHYQEARLKHSEVKPITEAPFLQATSACSSDGRGGCVLRIDTGLS